MILNINAEIVPRRCHAAEAIVEDARFVLEIEAAGQDVRPAERRDDLVLKACTLFMVGKAVSEIRAESERRQRRRVGPRQVLGHRVEVKGFELRKDESRRLIDARRGAPFQPGACRKVAMLLPLVRVGKQQAGRAGDAKRAVICARRDTQIKVGSELPSEIRRRRAVNVIAITKAPVGGLKAEARGVIKATLPAREPRRLTMKIEAAAFAAELELRHRRRAAPRHQLNSAGHGVRAEQGACRPAHDFDAVKVFRRQRREVKQAASRVDRHAVNQHLVVIRFAATRKDRCDAATPAALRHHEAGNQAQGFGDQGLIHALQVVAGYHANRAA